MIIPWNWKLCSFWMSVFAWVCLVCGVILLLLSMKEPLPAMLFNLIYGVLGFASFKVLSLFCRAAEAYLGLNQAPEGEEEVFSEEN